MVLNLKNRPLYTFPIGEYDIAFLKTSNAWDNNTHLDTTVQDSVISVYDKQLLSVLHA